MYTLKPWEQVAWGTNRCEENKLSVPYLVAGGPMGFPIWVGLGGEAGIYIYRVNRLVCGAPCWIIFPPLDDCRSHLVSLGILIPYLMPPTNGKVILDTDRQPSHDPVPSSKEKPTHGVLSSCLFPFSLPTQLQAASQAFCSCDPQSVLQCLDSDV